LGRLRKALEWKIERYFMEYLMLHLVVIGHVFSKKNLAILQFNAATVLVFRSEFKATPHKQVKI
jgi:hypothetical protein